MKEIQIPWNEIQIVRNEIQAGWNKIQIGRNEIQIQNRSISVQDPALSMTYADLALSRRSPGCRVGLRPPRDDSLLWVTGIYFKLILASNTAGGVFAVRLFVAPSVVGSSAHCAK
jgi:hypothetical protein